MIWLLILSWRCKNREQKRGQMRQSWLLAGTLIKSAIQFVAHLKPSVLISVAILKRSSNQHGLTWFWLARIGRYAVDGSHFPHGISLSLFGSFSLCVQSQVTLSNTSTSNTHTVPSVSVCCPRSKSSWSFWQINLALEWERTQKHGGQTCDLHTTADGEVNTSQRV